MELLDPGFDFESFARQINEAKKRVLLLDYDGTLAPFREERMNASPWPGISDLLSALQADESTDVVIISGRPVQEVLDLLEMESAPEIWGAHGFERRLPDTKIHSIPLPEEDEAMMDRLHRSVLAAVGEEHCERKVASIACHTRGLEPKEAKDVERKFREAISVIPYNPPFRLTEFDGGLELRHNGTHKGESVAGVMLRYQPGTPAVYLGDDLTDEDAFRAVMKHGAGVLVREEGRATEAVLRIHPPEELKLFLTYWLQQTLHLIPVNR